MRKLIVLALLGVLWTSGLRAQVVIDTSAVVRPGDVAQFRLILPPHYSPATPPPILVWWHGYGGDDTELTNTAFAAEIAARGWIGACHVGPSTIHYNGRQAQDHCQAMLDWIGARYPFSMDSIYMGGSSMGGASGQIWHNNHCGIHDYLLAAAIGGSQILDCQLRQEQYLAQIPSDTNRAMRALFGGLPADCAAVAFEYHRTSAIFAADTSQSNHFNALHLPVYNVYGNDSSEEARYGFIAGIWDSLRRADRADTTLTFQSNLPGHGYPMMHADHACAWLAGFAVNRFPDTLSINADEDDEYYWTKVELADTHCVWGRYGATKSMAEKRIDIQLVRNVRSIEVECEFPWAEFDTLAGQWINLDVAHVPAVTVKLSSVPPPLHVRGHGGVELPFTWDAGTMSVEITSGGDYEVIFGPNRMHETTATRPVVFRLLAAYPNPFNSQISLEIESAGLQRQEIRLYDITGRVAKNVFAELQMGRQRVTINAAGLASGVYFLSLPGTAQSPAKIVLLR